MNVGYDEKELKTYNEPEQDFNDLKRIGNTHTTILSHKHPHYNTFTQSHQSGQNVTLHYIDNCGMFAIELADVSLLTR